MNWTINSTFLDWLAVIYCAGFVIYLLIAINVYQKMAGRSTFANMPLQGKNIKLIALLLFQTIIWPAVLVSKTNPITLLSELLFNRYGDPGRRYMGSKGLKNFVYDCIYGKKRYRSYQLKQITCVLEDCNGDYQKLRQVFGKRTVYMNIYYGKKRNKYYLCVIAGLQPTVKEGQQASNYVLDDGDLLSESLFIKRVTGINKLAAETILADLGIHAPNLEQS
ncbi:hypothetical protein ACFORL_09480 [Legionella dresdenensis]|uniref:Transmembrane protein n=1 Tax=Legionella dresdenensis TaxID=450200 RepID=A0ABV8CGE0_9GAMM